MLKRSLKKKLDKALKRSPVTLLAGGRQTGKTTLSKAFANQAQCRYVTFDDVATLSAAQQDPVGFLEAKGNKSLVIDEVQRLPELFLSIKKDVDENRIAGRYLLTGSANPLMISRVSDSLAGRMEILYLWPLSQSEIAGSNKSCIDMLMNDTDFELSGPPLSKADLYQCMIIGGFPAVQGLDDEARTAWFDSYITTLLYRDVQDLAHISGLIDMPRLLKLLASRVANLFNTADVSRSIGIPTTTLRRYLVLLETLFLVQFQLPYFNNMAKRLIKAPKIQCIDTGLVSFLLNLNVPRLLEDQKMAGQLLENFVYMELRKHQTWSESRVSIMHMRNVTGNEVDVVLEAAGGEIIGIEVKNSATVTAQDFKGLRFLQDATPNSFVRGVVFYTGSTIIPFGNKLWALPVWWLW